MNFRLNSQKLLATTIALIIIGMTVPPSFAQTGAEYEVGAGPPNTNPIGPNSLTLDDDGSGVTFFGNGGYSADGQGTLSSTGSVTVDVPAGATVEKAILYATTQGSVGLVTVDLTLSGTLYTLTETPMNTYDGCCGLESFKYSGADLDAQVQALLDADDPASVTVIPLDEGAAAFSTDGSYLVVIYSHPASPEVSILVLDGSTSTSGETTTIGLTSPLDKTIPGFTSTLSLGIGFSFQNTAGGAFSHVCGAGSAQFSTVLINSATLTECAGHMDDGDTISNGALATIGGFGDLTDNPPVPANINGLDDELYDLEPFLAQGITQIDMDTQNTSADDLIFLSIFEITAEASLEICDDGIDNDGDGMIDEGCDDDTPVGGEFLAIDSAALLVAGAQANAIWILSALAVIGSVAFGALYITSKRD